MKKNKVQDRQPALQPLQTAPMRRLDNVASCQAAEAQNPLMGIEASFNPPFGPMPFAGDDAE